MQEDISYSQRVLAISYTRHMNDVRQRIEQLLVERGVNYAAASAAVGKNQAYIQQYLKRGTPRVLPEEIRLRLAAFLKVDQAELGGVQGATDAGVALAPSSAQGIAEVEVRAGAGGGGIPVEHYETDENGNTALTEGVRGHWHLPDQVTREVMHSAPNHLRIFEVIGDSMEPRLFEGDRVFVDTRYRVPAPEGMFALWDGYSVVIKRVQVVRDSDPQRIRIISANESYQAYEATIDEVNVIGRYVARMTTR